MDNNNNQAAITRGSGFFLTFGWISALISLVLYPPVFGVLGVIMGIMATKNKNRAGLPLIVASIVLMGIGLIFSNVFQMYVRLWLGI